jgi:hypothetical protein
VDHGDDGALRLCKKQAKQVKPSCVCPPATWVQLRRRVPCRLRHHPAEWRLLLGHVPGPNVMCRLREKTSHHAAGPTCRFFFYLRPRAPRPSRVSVAVGDGRGCGGGSRRRRWRRAARGLAADEVRVRARVMARVRVRGSGLRGCWGPSPLPATLERRWGRREARRWRRVAGLGGRRLDKRWARDWGGGGDDLPPVMARRISARGVAADGSDGGSCRR